MSLVIALASTAVARAQECGGGDLTSCSGTTATAAPAIATASRMGDAILSALVVLIGVGGAVFIWLRERRGENRPAVRNPLRRAEWSPYAAGIGLGLVAAASLGLFGHRLGASGAFLGLGARLGAWLAPRNEFFAGHAPELGWSQWIVAGIFLGSLASSLAGGTFNLRYVPDKQWTDVFGGGRARRLGIAFLGAALIEYAASIAGGCTSGLAISGGVALAPGAFVFIAAMFAGGIPTAWLVYRRRP